MAILKIAKMGHPILRQVAEKVEDPTSPEIQQLLSDMRETMVDAGGVGLAAPQVHKSLRIVIFQIRTETNPDEVRYKEQVLINPIIEFLSNETQQFQE